MEIEKLDFKLKEGQAVCFDFDGVIHKYSKGWQDGSIYDEYNKNVLDLMLLLKKLGMPIFVCSTRKPEQIVEWWNNQGFWAEAIKIKEDTEFWKDEKFVGVTNKKLPAQLYIDDRAYKWEGQTIKQFLMDNSEIKVLELLFEGYETVFPREEIKEMTLKEIEKELGYKIKIIEEEE